MNELTKQNINNKYKNKKFIQISHQLNTGKWAVLTRKAIYGKLYYQFNNFCSLYRVCLKNTFDQEKAKKIVFDGKERKEFFLRNQEVF